MTNIGSQERNDFRKLSNYTLLFAFVIGLYFTSRINYLLFHSLAEIFSIVIAFSLFVVAWNSKKYIENQYLIFIGISYLFVGFLDLLHSLSYKGMPIFTDYDFYANQLWIAARYLESISLLVAFYFLSPQNKVNVNGLLVVFTLVTTALIVSIFVLKVFPECFVAGQGLTAFKINSEYVICGILICCLVLLHKNKNNFDHDILKLLFWALIFTIIAELAFTFYVSNYGLSNLVGHYFKIFSFYMVYLSIIKTGIENPYNVIFLKLDQSNKKLHEEIEIRKKIELGLNKALADVRQLSGMLPICSSCKNIRDDKGYWRQIEAYVKEHSDASFSHGICPDCVKKLYPDIADNVLKSQTLTVRYTGLASRAYFEKIFHKEWKRCLRDKKQFSLIILDFPNMIKFEKAAVLEVEKCLRESIKRPTDYLTGYEDDSYGVILSDTDSKGARQVADNIFNDYVTFRKNYTQHDLSSLSIGVFIVTTDLQENVDPEEFLIKTAEIIAKEKTEAEETIIHKIL